MLKKAKLWDTLNLIITSDHGMTQCSEERVIELDQYLDKDHYVLIDRSPVAAILPKEGKSDGAVVRDLVCTCPVRLCGEILILCL